MAWFAAAAMALAAMPAGAGTLSVYCTHDPDACELAAQTFTRDTLGGMAIIANGPNPADARKFYDWALTPTAQELANRTRNLILPANRAADVRPEAARFATAPTVEIDAAKFGAPAEKKRLLARWQREIGDAAN